jgi:hypothetical protein
MIPFIPSDFYLTFHTSFPISPLLCSLYNDIGMDSNTPEKAENSQIYGSLTLLPSPPSDAMKKLIFVEFLPRKQLNVMWMIFYGICLENMMQSALGSLGKN